MQENEGIRQAHAERPEWERLALAGGRLRKAFELLDASNDLAGDFGQAAVAARTGFLDEARADVAEANRLLGRT